jgi:hypothetical protein
VVSLSSYVGGCALAHLCMLGGGGQQNAFHLLVYTNKSITIRQHCNSRDLLLLNVAARAGRCQSKESSSVKNNSTFVPRDV